MNHLHRELAPISDDAWAEIDTEAKRSLTHFMAARKIVDFDGPKGWSHSAVALGRAVTLTDGPAGSGVSLAQRNVLPLVELVRPFTLRRSEIDDIDRGAKDPDLDAVTEAARDLATAEDHLVFDGHAGAGIEGIAEVSPHDPIALSDDFSRYPNHVAAALAVLKDAGVEGPYAIAVGPRCYEGIITSTERGGYPVLQHLGLILDGPVVWAPAVDGAIVVSMRGGDFELTVGQDVSIGYRSHDAATVTLELRESVAFVAAGPEAAIALRY